MPYRVGHGNAGLTGGEVKLVTPADGAPGAVTLTPYTVPAGRLSRILYVSAKFKAGATVGSRTTVLSIFDAGGTRIFSTSFAAVAENAQASVYAFGPVPTGTHAENGGSSRGIPGGPWPEGVSVELFAFGGKAGDVWADIRLLVEEWEGV